MKKSFKFKNITISMLAIMLCVAMLFSFSLSVCAVDMSTALILAGADFHLCSAMCSTEKITSSKFQSQTEPNSNIQNIIMVSVALTVNDGDDHTASDYQYNFEGSTTMSDAIAIAESDISANSAEGYHELWATDGLTYHHTTGLDY